MYVCYTPFIIHSSILHMKWPSSACVICPSPLPSLPSFFLPRGRIEEGSTEPHLPKVELTRCTVSHPYILQDAYMAAGAPLPFTRKVTQ